MQKSFENNKKKDKHMKQPKKIFNTPKWLFTSKSVRLAHAKKYLVFKHRKLDFHFWIKPISTCKNYRKTTEKSQKYLISGPGIEGT
jgi:hypothetical protein